MSIMEFGLYVLLPLLSVGVVCVFFRLVRGPSLADRVVALDMLGTLGIGIIGIYSVVRNQPVFLDVAIILALLLFLGTVAFAYYLEKRVGS